MQGGPADDVAKCEHDVNLKRITPQFIGQYVESCVVSPQLHCGRTNLHKIRHAASF